MDIFFPSLNHGLNHLCFRSSFIYLRAFNKCLLNFKVHENHLGILLKLRFWFGKCGVGWDFAILTSLQGVQASGTILWLFKALGESSFGTLEKHWVFHYLDCTWVPCGLTSRRFYFFRPGMWPKTLFLKNHPWWLGLRTTDSVSDRTRSHQKQSKHPVCIKN